jgi:hypothetical protein
MSRQPLPASTRLRDCSQDARLGRASTHLEVSDNPLSPTPLSLPAQNATERVWSLSRGAGQSARLIRWGGPCDERQEDQDERDPHGWAEIA